MLSLLMAAPRPLYRARRPTQRHLHKCPVTVGEYSSIFFHRSLLTPMYSRNFTSQTLCSSFDWGLSRSKARILRPVVDPPTLRCRRFRSPAGRRLLGLAAFSCYPRTREGRRFQPFPHSRTSAGASVPAHTLHDQTSRQH